MTRRAPPKRVFYIVDKNGYLCVSTLSERQTEGSVATWDRGWPAHAPHRWVEYALVEPAGVTTFWRIRLSNGVIHYECDNRKACREILSDLRTGRGLVWSKLYRVTRRKKGGR